MVERVTHNDVDAIADLLDKCDKARDYMPKSNKKHFADALHIWLGMSNFAGFCTENAVCMGWIEVCYANKSASNALELTWLSNGKDGFDVFRAWENWAWDMGATHIYISTDLMMHNDAKSKVRDKQLKKMDYKPIQTKWEKVLV